MTQKLTDRNPHTGDKMQTKLPSDAYRSNYDAIFRKSKPLLMPIPPSCDHLELSDDIELDTAESNVHEIDELIIKGFSLTEILCGPDDGYGYFATKDGYSNQHPFGYVTRPEWATHFVWYNK